MWWNAELGEVRLYTYDYEEADENIRYLINLKPVLIIRERCNCDGQIRHFDGGNYHSVKRVFKITDEVYLLTHEDTREPFEASELRYVVLWFKDDVVGKVVLKTGEWAELITKEEVEELLKAYKEDKNYQVYTYEEN
jgi:hypothetical protein